MPQNLIVTSPWLAVAGALCIVLAVIHSVLGESLIFKSASPIPRSQIGILRATWHGLSCLGLAIALILWRVPLDGVSAFGLAAALITTGGLVAVWTRFRHLGWLVLMLIGLLVLGARL